MLKDGLAFSLTAANNDLRYLRKTKIEVDGFRMADV